MAKICAECGKEINLIQQVQLGTGDEFVCRACAKKAIPYYFEPREANLEIYKAHLQQNADGQKLYDAYFKKNKKVKKLSGKTVLYNPDTALLCIAAKRTKFAWIGDWYYNVFRVADLDKYEKVSKFSKGTEGQNVEKLSILLTFHNAPGVAAYAIATDNGTIKKMTKTFNEIFNGKGLSAIKAGIAKTKTQITAAADAAASFKNAMGAMKEGDGQNTAEAEAQAAKIMEDMETAFYAGREELIAKADAAIQAVLG